MPELGEQKLSPLMSWLWLTHWLGCARQITCPFCVVTLVLLLQTVPTSLLSYLLESHYNDWECKASLSYTLRDPGSKNRGSTTATTVTPEGGSSSHLPFSYLSASVLCLKVLRGLRSKKEARTVSSPDSVKPVKPALPSRVCLFCLGAWYSHGNTDGKMAQEVRC